MQNETNQPIEPSRPEPFRDRVRETLITAGLLCIAGVVLRFFAPVLAGKNDTLFLRTNALHQIALWLYGLGGVLLILCFAFWLADGMLADSAKRKRS